MMRRILLALAFCVFLACGVTPKAQTPVVAPAELEAIGQEISAAEAESAKYAGGLVKAMIDLRLATLKQTKAMLEQKRAAGAIGVALRYTVDGKAFQLPANATAQIASIEREIGEMDTKIAAQRTEAARYSGGLVQALALSTLATMEQSRAMLDQKRLALKYGLPQFVGFHGEEASPAPAAHSSIGTPGTLSAAPEWSIVSVASRVTEQNDTWWKNAWRLTLKNDSAQPLMFNATIEFQDADGFVIDDDSAYNLVVQPGTENTFTGYALVRMPGATRVVKTNAKVSLAR